MTDYRHIAKYRWPHATWVWNDGRFASVAHCGTLTVVLFPSLAAALEAKAGIDQLGCGGQCHGEHEITDLDGPKITSVKTTRVRKARITSRCPFCRRTITCGEQIASRYGGPFGHIAHFTRTEPKEMAS